MNKLTGRDQGVESFAQAVDLAQAKASPSTVEPTPTTSARKRAFQATPQRRPPPRQTSPHGPIGRGVEARAVPRRLGAAAGQKG
jgi:hypothetical protein